MATDEALMSRFQQGDNVAFEQIVRRWERRMLDFFYRAVGDMDTAKDMRQELFVRLYLRGETYRHNGRFGTWLFTIAANLMRSHFRKEKTRRSGVSLESAKGCEGFAVADDDSRGDEVARRNERARLVREMLATLSPNDREILHLRYFGELRYGEIARIVGTSEGNARVQACRALDRLRLVVDERGLDAGELL